MENKRNFKKKRHVSVPYASLQGRATDFDMAYRSVTRTVASSKATSWHNPRSA